MIGTPAIVGSGLNLGDIWQYWQFWQLMDIAIS
jgi:hypothetical protein